MKILIAMPVYGDIDPTVALSMVQMTTYTARVRPDIQLMACIDRRTYRHFARAAIAGTAIAEEADYVLFLDSDMVYEPDALLRLLEHDKDIVSAIYFQRSRPTGPVMYRMVGDKWATILDWPEGELIKVGGVGMGVCLVKTSVFKKIPKPWFATPQDRGEDMFFCERAIKAGLEIYVDTSVEAGHLFEERVVIRRAHFDHDRQEAGEYYGKPKAVSNVNA